MNKMTFNISGGKQIWEQQEHDNAVRLYSLVDDWTEEDEVIISQGDMVMLANLYRVIKENNIANSYINPHGNKKLAIGDDLVKALERQMPKKPKGETDPMFGDVKTVCPSCGNANLVNPFVRSRVYDYCPNCGQALDWSEENGNK